MRVLAYPGMFFGTVSRDLDTHFTVLVTAKHSQDKGHPESWWGVKKRSPQNTKTAKTHIVRLTTKEDGGEKKDFFVFTD